MSIRIAAVLLVVLHTPVGWPAPTKKWSQPVSGPKVLIAILVLALVATCALNLGERVTNTHDAYGYRISAKQDGDDTVFRYETASRAGYQTVRQSRAADVREGVWYNGRSQMPNYRAALSSG